MTHIQIVEISVASFLEKYESGNIENPITVKVGTQQRIYGRTTEGQANNPDGYIVVYAVVT